MRKKRSVHGAKRKEILLARIDSSRVQSREHFTPGKFIAPHGACFDHAGNIFVVEWVEVGRVTKLRMIELLVRRASRR